MGQMDYEEKSQSCCTWFKVGVVGLALIVTGILIWQFAPIDNAINNVLPTFNNTASQNLGSNASSLGGNATSPPTSSSFYEFMKCADPSSPDCCNGLDGGFCDMRVNEVLYATSHNANADFESGFFVTPNHQYKLEESLKAGYRGINVDVCNCGGQLQFCHGICNFGTRDVIEVLTGINDFLDENPSEVLILPIEINSGVDQPVDIDEFYGLMLQVPGFVEKFYEHQNATAEWPTLGQLVQSGQRVIVFQFRGPACDETEPCPPGIHPYYRYAINTQWNLANLNAVANSTFACTFAQAPEALGKTFFGLNNFVSPPVQSSARKMNEYDYVANRIDTCSSFHGGLEVNFVYIDFWSEGDVPRLVQERNAAKVLRRKLETSRE